VDGIAHAFKAIFEHVSVHVQGYYRNSPEPATDQEMASLAELLAVPVAEAGILRAHETCQMLEGVLKRWIIERLSLRSEVDQSLLPAEYAGLPKHVHWDMETHETKTMSEVESRKGKPT